MELIRLFNEKISKKNVNWTIKGLVDENDIVFSLGSDSKLIGRIFEIITHNILKEIAEENGYTLEPSESQTVYPDYTFVNNIDNSKIAVDIKTTYRDYKKNGQVKSFVYCLGSYKSYIRKNTKNIKYPFDEYEQHYAICFLYDRNKNAQEGLELPLKDIDKLNIPYDNVQCAIQEKYKIVGDYPGAGNTENIGSFKTNNFQDIIDGNGPFTVLGEDIMLDYWAYYPDYRAESPNYKRLAEYFKWRLKNPTGKKEIEKIRKPPKKEEIKKAQKIYENWLTNRINN
jgi:hypothetical protein